MAELAVFSLASHILSIINSPTLKMAYEKGRSIWEARDQLDKLRETVETIHAVLLDAENKQEGSAAVRNWIKRVKGVLYEADDLFDEVATDAMLKQQMKGNKHLKKVRVSFSKLNPVISSNSIAQKVKAIRKSLHHISRDMAQFQFVQCEREEAIWTGMRKKPEGWSVDSKEVYGRDEDKKAILEMLLHDQSSNVSVIAIVGIGGMGKTTLAQLVYNDEEVKKRFEKRWFASIYDISDDNIIGKIFQSICGGESYGDSDVSQLQTRIRESIEGKIFLLVLDDVWGDNRHNWAKRMSLLGYGAKGSKIIVTTRSSSVARAVGAVKTHNLDGLSEDDSWNLFRRVVAFTPEQEEDSKWTNLGRQILKKCANVPLAITSIGSLLNTKSTFQEWEFLSKEELPELGQNDPESIMPMLKLSYYHLEPDLKQCFAYCALFPKGYEMFKEKLIYLWIAQGYIKPNNENQTVEEMGHVYFMDLVRRSFFRVEDYTGDHIWSCKMHDLIHDLAQHVAGEESIMVTTSSNRIIHTQHASFGYLPDDLRHIPASLFTIKRLRSLLIICADVDDQNFSNLKCLRTLSLPGLHIENVPSSIGELKHLRYLDISENPFEILPDSITKLLNLCMLNINNCDELEALPNDFRKLINLRHLDNEGCRSLKYMPPGFEELTCLQHLNEFKVGRGMDRGQQRSKIGELAGAGLRGKLLISYTDGTDDWDGVECWRPPVNLQVLGISGYQGMRIPNWASGRAANLPNITHLDLCDCSRVKCLPPFRHLPSLTSVRLQSMNGLEYIQEEEENEGNQDPRASTSSNALYLPCLDSLHLYELPKLKGWSRKVQAAIRSKDREEYSSSTCASAPPQFPCLFTLMISSCPKLKSMPLCPSLDYLTLSSGKGMVIPQLLSIRDSYPPTTLSTSLRYVSIYWINDFSTFPGESLTSLQSLTIRYCEKLKRVDLAPLRINILGYLSLCGCPELELWEGRRGVDWDSLPNLHTLWVDEIPSPERLPNRLRYNQALGQLLIRKFVPPGSS